MVLTSSEVIVLLGTGLAAGAVGGMLGIGGSILIIPVLTLALGTNQHLSQAAAMIINVLVSLPALLQHHRAQAVQWNVFARLIVFGALFIILGVEASNQMSGDVLKKVFGVFLLYVIATNMLQLAGGKPEPERAEQRVGWLATGAVGAMTGFVAGVLGIGGGIVMVPLLQRICRLPLRQGIATTAAFMCVSASFGAIRKNATLASLTDHEGFSLGLQWVDSALIASLLAPTAILGGLIGGRLTHALPLVWVRITFILLMIWASANMLGLV